MSFKKYFTLIILITWIISSCSKNSLLGEKYYVLNCKLSGYVPTLQELELTFISDKYLEAKETLNSSLGEIRTYKNDSLIGKQKQLFEYTFDEENGVLEIKSLKLLLSLKKSDSGNLISNAGEILYKSSIVEIIETEEARDRVRKACPISSLREIFADMLKPNIQNNFKPSQDTRSKNKEYYNEQLDKDTSKIEEDSINNIL